MTAVYAQGTRPLIELMWDARKMAYAEQYSYTEGWDNNTVVEIFNLALNNLYQLITEINNPANIEQVEMDVVSQQQAYDLPIQVQMAIRLVDVRYLYGTQSWEFVTLTQGMIQDRFGYPTNIPDMFCIRNGQILLSPAPNISKPNSLIINYQKRMRSLDIPRGRVASFTTSPVVFTLNFSVPSQKYSTMQADANSILDRVNYCTIVDWRGNPIVNAIPIFGYNFTTLELSALPDYVMPADEQAALTAALAANQMVFVVTGDYASTHSELDRECENNLIEYAILRLYRLQSTAEPTQWQLESEQTALGRLLTSYRRNRPSVYPIIWQERLRPRSWPWGRRGMY